MAKSDVCSFLDSLARLHGDETLSGELASARGLFYPNRTVFVARAPGRLDVMGGIADYSGSLVLQMVGLSLPPLHAHATPGKRFSKLRQSREGPSPESA